MTAPDASPSGPAPTRSGGTPGDTAGATARDTTVPSATYRVQVQPGFTFADTAARVPYLAALGVSHLHLSPVLEAVPGSTHGYDVVDHSRVRAELGGEEGLRELSRRAREHGLGLVLDIVPNHMAVPAPEHLNQALWAVLRDGPDSPYAAWFDVDWDAQDGRLLLPVLGEPLPEPGEGPAPGALSVVEDESAGGRVLRYHDHRFPLRPGTEDLPLPGLPAAQHYRLAYWRTARTDLNYRRFFTISDLIAVRVERPEVFEATHATVLRLLREGVADGLRIDHPDGLADPEGYLRRLAAAAGGRWTVVEKILQRAEPLPAGWACAGTTGYDALDRIDGLFTDPAGVRELAGFYREFTCLPDDLGGRWAPTAARAARQVVTRDLAAEVSRLARGALRAGPQPPAHAPESVERALQELLVRIPVYRSYVRPGEPPAAADVRLLTEAARGAAEAVGEQLAPVVAWLRDLALGRGPAGPDAADFLVRLPQVASALHAKSVEDAAFYRYTPLLPLCEVGRDPAHPATTPEEFHAYCAAVLRDRPATGTVLSTHDTKRGADVRLRLAVLSELPGAWREWLTAREARGAALGSAPAPDRHTAWTLFQTAVGLGAGRPERLVPAALKYVREAGLRTSWTEGDEVYEKAVADFAAQGPGGSQAEDVAAFARTLEPYATANSLGAALLHLTMPGVPDVYQGTEFRVATLVDPDNRGPLSEPEPGVPRADVDRLLARLLSGAEPAGPDEAKLRLTALALRLRRAHPEWYGPRASYAPLPAEGPAAPHCVAFVRGGGALTVATRLSRRLENAGGWRTTALALPGGRWLDHLTGTSHEGRVPLTTLLSTYPVALLTRQE
jgi:(1->4)-alpha-D-glucan 1-alpha-D-glucosylmutase